MDIRDNHFFVGIGGSAGTGKDTFAKMLKTEIDSQRDSPRVGIEHFADELKRYFQDKMGNDLNTDFINPEKISKDEKNLIRPLLVHFCEIIRPKTKGRFWREKLENNILNKYNQFKSIILIPDHRFAFYTEDEHLLFNKGLRFFLKRPGISPANEVELENERYLIPLCQVIELPDIDSSKYAKIIKDTAAKIAEGYNKWI